MFLAKGAGLELGEQIGCLEMVVGFWEHRFGGGRVNAMSPSDMLDGMRDLIQGLSSSPQTKPEPEAEPEAEPVAAEPEAALREAAA